MKILKEAAPNLSVQRTISLLTYGMEREAQKKLTVYAALAMLSQVQRMVVLTGELVWLQEKD